MSDPPSPPGWYPAEEGFVRWWDGTRWGPPKPAASLDAAVDPAAEDPASDDPEAAPARSTRPATGERAPVQLPAYPGDNSRTLVTLSHLGVVLGGFIMPLTVYLVDKRRPFVRHHAAEALNFQLSVLTACVLSVPLMTIYVGFFTFAVAVLADVALSLVGVQQANRGRWWRYPLAIRFVRP
ncbi:MAG: DUF4870 domain-containing protein [Acidimicrobiia bacterium]